MSGSRVMLDRPKLGRQQPRSGDAAAELPRVDAELPPVKSVADDAVVQGSKETAQKLLLDPGVKRFFSAHPELLDGFRDPISLRLPGEFAQMRPGAPTEQRTVSDRLESLQTELRTAKSAGRRQTLAAQIRTCEALVADGRGDEPYLDRSTRDKVMAEQRRSLATYVERLAKAAPDGSGGIDFAAVGKMSMNEIHSLTDPAKYHRRPTVVSMPASAEHLEARPGATRAEVLAMNRAESDYYKAQDKRIAAEVKAREEARHRERFGGTTTLSAEQKAKGPTDQGQRMEWIAAQTRITVGQGSAADYAAAPANATDWSRGSGALQMRDTIRVGQAVGEFRHTLRVPPAGSQLGEAFVENLARQADPRLAGLALGDAARYRTECVKTASVAVGGHTGAWLKDYALDSGHDLKGMNSTYYRSLFVDHLNKSLSGDAGKPGMMNVKPDALSKAEYAETWNAAHVAALQQFGTLFTDQDRKPGTTTTESMRERFARQNRGAEFDGALREFRAFVASDQYLTDAQRQSLLSALPTPASAPANLASGGRETTRTWR